MRGSNGMSDILVTDYSGICIDYRLLNRQLGLDVSGARYRVGFC